MELQGNLNRKYLYWVSNNIIVLNTIRKGDVRYRRRTDNVYFVMISKRVGFESTRAAKIWRLKKWIFHMLCRVCHMFPHFLEIKRPCMGCKLLMQFSPISKAVHLNPSCIRFFQNRWRNALHRYQRTQWECQACSKLQVQEHNIIYTEFRTYIGNDIERYR